MKKTNQNISISQPLMGLGRDHLSTMIPTLKKKDSWTLLTLGEVHTSTYEVLLLYSKDFKSN